MRQSRLFSKAVASLLSVAMGLTMMPAGMMAQPTEQTFENGGGSAQYEVASEEDLLTQSDPLETITLDQFKNSLTQVQAGTATKVSVKKSSFKISDVGEYGYPINDGFWFWFTPDRDGMYSIVSPKNFYLNDNLSTLSDGLGCYLKGHTYYFWSQAEDGEEETTVTVNCTSEEGWKIQDKTANPGASFAATAETVYKIKFKETGVWSVSMQYGEEPNVQTMGLGTCDAKMKSMNVDKVTVMDAGKEYYVKTAYDGTVAFSKAAAFQNAVTKTSYTVNETSYYVFTPKVTGNYYFLYEGEGINEENRPGMDITNMKNENVYWLDDVNWLPSDAVVKKTRLEANVPYLLTMVNGNNAYNVTIYGGEAAKTIKAGKNTLVPFTEYNYSYSNDSPDPVILMTTDANKNIVWYDVDDWPVSVTSDHAFTCSMDDDLPNVITFVSTLNNADFYLLKGGSAGSLPLPGKSITMTQQQTALEAGSAWYYSLRGNQLEPGSAYTLKFSGLMDCRIFEGCYDDVELLDDHYWRDCSDEIKTAGEMTYTFIPGKNDIYEFMAIPKSFGYFTCTVSCSKKEAEGNLTTGNCNITIPEEGKVIYSFTPSGYGKKYYIFTGNNHENIDIQAFDETGALISACGAMSQTGQACLRLEGNKTYSILFSGKAGNYTASLSQLTELTTLNSANQFTVPAVSGSAEDSYNSQFFLFEADKTGYLEREYPEGLDVEIYISYNESELDASEYSVVQEGRKYVLQVYSRWGDRAAFPLTVTIDDKRYQIDQPIKALIKTLNSMENDDFEDYDDEEELLSYTLMTTDNAAIKKAYAQYEAMPSDSRTKFREGWYKGLYNALKAAYDKVVAAEEKAAKEAADKKAAEEKAAKEAADKKAAEEKAAKEAAAKKAAEEAAKKAAEEAAKKAQQSQTPATTEETPKAGDVEKVGKAKYKVLSEDTVTFMAPTVKNKTSYTVPATVKIKGRTMKVTKVQRKAFKGCKKMTMLIIGKNVKEIGSQAANGCSKLKTVNIKSKKLTKVGAKAFWKIAGGATVKVPSAKKGAYKKLLKGKIQKTTKVK